MRRRIFIILFSLAATWALTAEPLREYLRHQTGYWGIQEKVSAAELDQLVQMKEKADQPGLNQEDRTKAYTELFHYVQKLRGLPEGKVPATMAASYWTAGQSPVPVPSPFAKPGQLGNFQKRGSGKIPMVLIPDIAADWTVFDSFMQRNQEEFTFYAITLPGFGGTYPPEPHEKLDFGRMQWWENAGEAVMNLIAREKMDRPILLGHQAGGYLAAKLALQQPDRVRGAVVVNGLLYAALPGIPPGASIADRVSIVNSMIPVELWPIPSRDRYFELGIQFAGWFCKDKERQVFLTKLVTATPPSTWWNYFAELATTDLTAEIKQLRVPMLVLPSMHDQDSPGFENSKMTMQQWAPWEQSKSSLPITVIPMEDCRSYATEDQPAKLDAAVRQWADRLFAFGK